MNDKPLYFQGKWWFISETRDFFYTDKEKYDWEFYEPNPFWLHHPYHWNPISCL